MIEIILNYVPLVVAVVASLIIVNILNKKEKKTKNKFLSALGIGFIATALGHCVIYPINGIVVNYINIRNFILLFIVSSVLPLFLLKDTSEKSNSNTGRNHVDQPNVVGNSPSMTTCDACGKEMAKTAKACPHCGARNKKPIYLRAWFIVLVIIAAVFAYNKISAVIEDNNTIRATVITNSGETKQMTFEEIKEIAENNTILFENEYVGADITVTSTITAIGGSYLLPSWFDCEAYIELDASEYIGSWFHPVTEEYAASVNVGDTVTVSGKIGMATASGVNVYILKTAISPY